MSRYIDADALLRALAEMWYDSPISVTGISASQLIDKQPSIDIVRCKECRWAKANGTYQWCGRLDSTAQITANDFCSYGERREP